MNFVKSAPSMEGSPGSNVHNSRGALLEIPLRFLRTLLMMLPTPPEPCCRCRPPVLGLLPPPAPAWSLSCLISREGNRPARSAHRLVPTQSILSPPPPSSTVASIWTLRYRGVPRYQSITSPAASDFFRYSARSCGRELGRGSAHPSATHPPDKKKGAIVPEIARSLL